VAKSAKKDHRPAHDLDAPATQFVPKARLMCRLQQAGPQFTVHLEHGVRDNFSNLLDLLSCSFLLCFAPLR
jgi:hypothetical protein